MQEKRSICAKKTGKRRQSSPPLRDPGGTCRNQKVPKTKTKTKNQKHKKTVQKQICTHAIQSTACRPHPLLHLFCPHLLLTCSVQPVLLSQDQQKSPGACSADGTLTVRTIIPCCCCCCSCCCMNGCCGMHVWWCLLHARLVVSVACTFGGVCCT